MGTRRLETQSHRGHREKEEARGHSLCELCASVFQNLEDRIAANVVKLLEVAT